MSRRNEQLCYATTTQATTQVITQAMLEELSILEKQIIEIVSNAPRISQREIAGIVDVNYNNIRYYMEQLRKKEY